MFKSLVILLLFSSHFILLFFLIDQGISLAHMESDLSFYTRRNEALFTDISNVYLCADITKLNHLSNDLELKGVKLYIENNIVIAIGFKGGLSPKLECEVD